MLDAHGELKTIDAGGISSCTSNRAGARIDAEADRRRARTFGVSEHDPFTGHGASGSTPIPMRRDAFWPPPRPRSLPRDPIKYSKPGAALFCTIGVVNVSRRSSTAVPGFCEISLDQRRSNPTCSPRCSARARRLSEGRRRAKHVTAEWRPLWRIEPRRSIPR